MGRLFPVRSGSVSGPRCRAGSPAAEPCRPEGPREPPGCLPGGSTPQSVPLNLLPGSLDPSLHAVARAVDYLDDWFLKSHAVELKCYLGPGHELQRLAAQPDGAHRGVVAGYA